MAKQDMNTVDILAAVRELQFLVSGRFDKAFQPTREELMFRFRRKRPEGESDEDRARLPKGARESTKAEVVVGIGRYVLVTEYTREMPTNPSQFVMTLRKHLSGARVIAVRQHGLDRVIEFELERKEGTYLLVVELFGDGNVILVKDGRIVTALFKQSWAAREVRPGAEFLMPPAREDPRVMPPERFRERVRASSADVVRTLATEVNLGGTWAEEACARAGVAKNTPVAELADADVDALYDTLQRAFRQVEDGDLDPIVVKDGEEKVDVSPVPLAKHADADADRYPSFLEALDHYYSKPVTVERVDPRVKKLDDERAKVERMLAAQEGAIAKFEKESDIARVKGDTLYGHFDVVQKLTTELLAAGRQHGWKEVQAKLKEARKAGQPVGKTVEAINPSEGTATLALDGMDGKPVRISVDLRKSVQENAQAYYDRAKKQRDKLEGAKQAIEQTRGKLRDMEERGVKLIDEVEKQREKAAKATKRLWFEGYRWFVASTGNVVLAGRDAGSNEKLVKKHLTEKDRYLHADVSGAPSTVVKADGADVPEAALAEAAQFAVAMSRAWAAGVASGEAYWVLPSQVSKTPNPGEYVGRGAFIVRGKRNYTRVQTRLAVGEVEVEGVRKVMCGPVDALAARSKRYVVIEPGPEDKNKFANRMAKAFDVPVEEVQMVLPPGDVNVVERVGVE